MLDDREDVTPGEKFYYWELMGAPVRVEVGPREVAEYSATVARRDTLERVKVSFDELPSKVEELMKSIEANLLEKSRRMMLSLISDAGSVEEVKKILRDRRIARIEWCGEVECAERLKEEAGGEVRGERYDIAESPRGKCIVCGRDARFVVYVARAY